MAPIDKSKKLVSAVEENATFKRICLNNETSFPSYPSSSRFQHKPKHQPNTSFTPNHQNKFFKGMFGSVVQKQKGYDWDEEALSFEYDEFNSIKAFMTLVEDEPSYGKNDARPRQWVDITLKKEH
ncbi:hypothetical protein Tco_1376907 [Tanacetum coccineum]